MHVGVRIGLALAAPAVLAGCATSSGGDQMANTVYATHRIVRNLEQTLGSEVSKLNETALQLESRVAQSEQTSLRLQSMVEENQVKLNALQTDLGRLTDTLYRQMGLSTGAPAPSTPNAPLYVPSDQIVTTPPAGALSAPADPLEPAPLTMEGNVPMTGAPVTGAADPSAGGDNSPTALYSKANQLYMDQKYEEAIANFDSFLAQYPTNAYASNALFWKGVCLIKLERYQEAVNESQKFIDQYPSSDKVPQAYLQQGLAYGRLDQQHLAVEKLRYVVTNYPSTAAATTAQNTLDRLRP